MKKEPLECWLQITAGQGPDECGLAVYKLVKLILGEAKIKLIKASLIDSQICSRDGIFTSALFHLKGENLNSFTDS